MARIGEYFRNSDTPPVTGLVVVAYAIVRDERARVLVVRRVDDGNWELPGGRVEVGETASVTTVREVLEESGVAITLTGVAGIYSDPAHIVVYPVEGARQQFAVCFHARPITPDQQPHPDGIESDAAAWLPPADTTRLRMHPEVRRRLTDAVSRPATPQFD